MHPEDLLDALLARQRYHPPVRSVDWSVEERAADDLAPQLAAAQRVASYRALAPAPDFTRQLEDLLLAQAAGQRAQAAREDLPEAMSTWPAVSEPAGATWPEEPWHAMPIPRARPAPRLRTSPQRSTRRVARAWWPAVAALLLLVAGLSTLVAAVSASPGTSLYGLHRWEQNVRVGLASGAAARARLHLQYAQDALRALDTAVAQRSGEQTYDDSLATLDAELRATTTAEDQVPTGPDHTDLAAQLLALRTQAEHDLRAGLVTLAWPQRLATSTTLAYLGADVPQVTQVRIERSSSDGAQVWYCTVGGTGFLPGAVLLVNGQVSGTTVSISSTQLVARLTSYPSAPTPTAVGVGNPDGTAAATSQVSISTDDGGEHDGSETPGPQSTPGSGDNGSGSDHGGPGSHDATPTTISGGDRSDASHG